MIFEASLDTVYSELNEARLMARHVAGNLIAITNLQWQSSAGQAFERKVQELIEVLGTLAQSLDDAGDFVVAARRELESLEAQILGQRMAG